MLVLSEYSQIRRWLKLNHDYLIFIEYITWISNGIVMSVRCTFSYKRIIYIYIYIYTHREKKRDNSMQLDTFFGYMTQHDKTKPRLIFNNIKSRLNHRWKGIKRGFLYWSDDWEHLIKLAITWRNVLFKNHRLIFRWLYFNFTIEREKENWKC